MIPASVSAFAPATISNLGPGFDIIGLAINAPGDIARAQRCKEPGLHFSLGGRRSGIPSNPSKNVAAHVAALLLDEVRPRFGVRLHLRKLMPIGSGLGSSGASAVAALVAVNALLPNPLRRVDLLRFAMEGERMATGAAHADNVAPSLLGGVCLVRSYTPLDVVRLPVRNTILWVVVHPHVEVRTSDARRVLPKRISLKEAVHQWGNVGGLVAGLIKGNAHLVGISTHDVIVEPARANLTPGFEAVKTAACTAGAFGCSFSGSGPSVFAVTDSPSLAKRVATAMKRAFREAAGVQSDTYISLVNTRGARIMAEL